MVEVCKLFTWWLINVGFLYIPRVSIYKFGLSVCLFVCLFVSNKRQNGWTDRAQIFCGTSRDPREGLWKIKISNICLHQNSIVIKFLKILKIREIFCENPRIIYILFYDVHKENMFRTNLEDGREAPSKASTYFNWIAFAWTELSWTVLSISTTVNGCRTEKLSLGFRCRKFNKPAILTIYYH